MWKAIEKDTWFCSGLHRWVHSYIYAHVLNPNQLLFYCLMSDYMSVNNTRSYCHSLYIDEVVEDPRTCSDSIATRQWTVNRLWTIPVFPLSHTMIFPKGAHSVWENRTIPLRLILLLSQAWLSSFPGLASCCLCPSHPQCSYMPVQQNT